MRRGPPPTGDAWMLDETMVVSSTASGDVVAAQQAARSKNLFKLAGTTISLEYHRPVAVNKDAIE